MHVHHGNHSSRACNCFISPNQLVSDQKHERDSSQRAALFIFLNIKTLILVTFHWRWVYMHRWYLHGPINFYYCFWWNNLILFLYNVDTLNICMKEFGSEKIIFDKMIAVRTQLLMEQFDTFPIHCRHIEHMLEGVWFRIRNNIFD